MRANTVEARVAERARIVLMAADGASNRDIGATIGMHYNQVAVWRRRYRVPSHMRCKSGRAQAPRESVYAAAVTASVDSIVTSSAAVGLNS